METCEGACTRRVPVPVRGTRFLWLGVGRLRLALPGLLALSLATGCRGTGRGAADGSRFPGTAEGNPEQPHAASRTSGAATAATVPGAADAEPGARDGACGRACPPPRPYCCASGEPGRAGRCVARLADCETQQFECRRDSECPSEPGVLSECGEPDDSGRARCDGPKACLCTFQFLHSGAEQDVEERGQ